MVSSGGKGALQAISSVSQLVITTRFVFFAYEPDGARLLIKLPERLLPITITTVSCKAFEFRWDKSPFSPSRASDRSLALRVPGYRGNVPFSPCPTKMIYNVAGDAFILSLAHVLTASRTPLRDGLSSTPFCEVSKLK